ncbi:RBP11-like subunits of RNA polymerase [Conidiobolus coronatus NRRL 28638]|uniref:RBP11-like subunits of RNA polymerase n=1 Tax=Conidiobolus coronatus (strain ATCC 28846 / CBS 209.66 / NRRL 28638) TaxID=796925 RepID=A0A137PEZ4_CONC2|nr:RBP11-like subunits of RNA polymerase [Conidiobolus coronatus NRRL 28638]|eukprot:KXN73579.1 RBP11-like subunits of RNA polymerase [Conidiobolus coronatus NRRL 28638]
MDLTTQEIEGFEQFKVLTGSEDPTCVTFQFVNETHTLGNILRWFIMKNPSVDYCGYSLPHPLENKMNLRIQTSKDTTALEALKLAFQQLEQASDHLLETFAKEMQEGSYETLEDEDELVRKNVTEALKNANKMEE